ncbi:adck1 [Symbiodinium sp. KB8]|nr:adck1 [Symbiodinium sp. KB8]
MEMELREISDSIKAAIEATGDDPDRHQVLGLTLRTVNNNLKTLRTLKVGNLNFDPKIVEAGLLQHDGFFNEMAQKLEMSFKAKGHDSRDALQLTVYNPGDDTVTLRLPAGALFEPSGSKKCQNLVLREATLTDVKPGQRKTIGLWAFCANSNRSSPCTDLEPTDYVLKCELRDQASVWKATRMYER